MRLTMDLLLTMIRRWNGLVPAVVIAELIRRETGLNVYAVSFDKVLVEVGLSQAPLWRAWRLNADPFDLETAVWIACREAVDDALRWESAVREMTDEMGGGPTAANWAQRDRGLWYLCHLDYSVGSSALRHILRCTIRRAESAGRDPDDRGLMDEVVGWAEATDLSLPVHSRWWGRQTPKQILDRVRKHKRWILEEARLDDIDRDAGGPEPPMVRPDDLRPFPPELVPAARLCGVPVRGEQAAANHERVRQYARARARGGPHEARLPTLARLRNLIVVPRGRRRNGDGT